MIGSENFPVISRVSRLWVGKREDTAVEFDATESLTETRFVTFYSGSISPAFRGRGCEWAFFSIIILFSSCQKSTPVIPEPETQKILALSHTRTDADFKLSEEVSQIDFTQFEMLLLGGDLSVNSDSAVLDWLDKVYDLGNENTLWALGNHDYDRTDLIPEFTHRPLFYEKSWGKITFLVLDTQENSSQITPSQLDLINSVTDTLSETKYLVLLHHKLLWMPGHPELESQIPEVANSGLGDCHFCTNPNNFYDMLYPKLIEVKNKGIEVICLGGDIGFKSKSFEFQTTDGIWFLATGILAGDSGNLALVFEYDVEKGSLIWNFRRLNKL